MPDVAYCNSVKVHMADGVYTKNFFQKNSLVQSAYEKDYRYKWIKDFVKSNRGEFNAALLKSYKLKNTTITVQDWMGAVKTVFWFGITVQRLICGRRDSAEVNIIKCWVPELVVARSRLADLGFKFGKNRKYTYEWDDYHVKWKRDCPLIKEEKQRRVKLGLLVEVEDGIFITPDKVEEWRERREQARLRRIEMSRRCQRYGYTVVTPSSSDDDSST